MSTEKQISTDFLTNNGFLKRNANVVYYERNGIVITLDTTVNLWLPGVLWDGQLYYSAPILYLTMEKELIKYYEESTNKKF
jgi:hypothetical protein